MPVLTYDIPLVIKKLRAEKAAIQAAAKELPAKRKAAREKWRKELVAFARALLNTKTGRFTNQARFEKAVFRDTEGDVDDVGCLQRLKVPKFHVDVEDDYRTNRRLKSIDNRIAALGVRTKPLRMDEGKMARYLRGEWM
jgi:hypothetical protein